MTWRPVFETALRFEVPVRLLAAMEQKFRNRRQWSVMIDIGQKAGLFSPIRLAAATSKTQKHGLLRSQA